MSSSAIWGFKIACFIWAIFEGSLILQVEKKLPLLPTAYTTPAGIISQ